MGENSVLLFQEKCKVIFRLFCIFQCNISLIKAKTICFTFFCFIHPGWMLKYLFFIDLRFVCRYFLLKYRTFFLHELFWTFKKRENLSDVARVLLLFIPKSPFCVQSIFVKRLTPIRHQTAFENASFLNPCRAKPANPQKDVCSSANSSVGYWFLYPALPVSLFSKATFVVWWACLRRCAVFC